MRSTQLFLDERIPQLMIRKVFQESEWEEDRDYQKALNTGEFNNNCEPLCTCVFSKMHIEYKLVLITGIMKEKATSRQINKEYIYIYIYMCVCVCVCVYVCVF